MNPKKIFIIFFVVIIFTPTLMIPFYKSSTASENRAQVNFPSFTPQYPLLWKKNFEEYYNSNFAFRNDLYSVYKYYKLNLLGANPFPEDVVIGKDGWLFPGNKNERNYDQVLGVIPDLELMIDSISIQINEMKMFCDSLNIDFYLAVGPDKGSVYYKYLPVESHNHGMTLSKLTSSLKINYNIDVINLGDYFSELIDSKELYYKTDSHWNCYGAYLGTRKLLDVIREKYDVGHLEMEDYYKTPVLGTRMDLSAILEIDTKEVDDRLVSLDKQYSENTYFSYYDQFKIPFVETKKKNNRNLRFKCIVFRDSFFQNMFEFFCNNVDHAVLAAQKFDKELIIKERPNFVVYELVERRILSFDMNGFYL